MPKPPTRQLSVVRYAQGWGYAAREWAVALDQVHWGSTDNDSATCLKGTANDRATVWRSTIKLGHRPTAIVLKVETLTNWRAVVGSYLGLTKAHRQWRGSRRLRNHGIAAARGCALLRGRDDSGLCEALVLEYIADQTLLEQLARPDLSISMQHKLARAVGRYLARMHLNHLVNRDSKPSNLMVQWNDGEPKLTVIDTVAISRERPADHDRSLERMMRDLLLEPIGCGYAPRRSIMMRALRQCAVRLGVRSQPDWCKARWERVSALIAEHGDPTPRDNPLA